MGRVDLERTSSTHRHGFNVAAAFALALVAAAALLFSAQQARTLTRETVFQPNAMKLLGEGGDPRVILVGVTWTDDGYCPGEFHVSATETASEVKVGMVVRRTVLFGAGPCAGVGTVDNTAWAELRLASPLGSRIVIRESDGVVLPVRGP